MTIPADQLDIASEIEESERARGAAVEREAFEAWLGIKPCGAAHDLAVKAFQAGAAWQRAQGAVPEGWRLVPVEPTPAMLVAINWPNDPAGYRAMLAAAPAHPTERQEQEGLHVWRATTRFGETCHFGEASTARAWAGENGTVGRVELTPVPELRVVERQEQGEFGDAYQGAREDLAIWKRRALEAEARVRHQEQIIDQMGEDLNAINGPTCMGEPVIPAAQNQGEVQRLREALEGWNEAMANAGFTALEKRGFRVGASDLSIDDLKAVFLAMLAAAPAHPADRQEQAEIERLRGEVERLERDLATAHADEFCAMAYLSQVRAIVGGDDFPSVVERVRIETQLWKNQHERDSKELRRLCAERDQYRMRLRNALAHGSNIHVLPFMSKVLSKLRRFNEQASDSDADGTDIGRHWLDMLERLGLLNRVQKSPGVWEITAQGEDALRAYDVAAEDRA